MSLQQLPLGVCHSNVQQSWLSKRRLSEVLLVPSLKSRHIKIKPASRLCSKFRGFGSQFERAEREITRDFCFVAQATLFPLEGKQMYGSGKPEKAYERGICLFI